MHYILFFYKRYIWSLIFLISWRNKIINIRYCYWTISLLLWEKWNKWFTTLWAGSFTTTYAITYFLYFHNYLSAFKIRWFIFSPFKMICAYIFLKKHKNGIIYYYTYYKISIYIYIYIWRRKVITSTTFHRRREKEGDTT